MYFENLRKHFARTVPDEEVEFVKLWHDGEKDTFQRIVLSIIEESPNIAFLDYSVDPLKVLTLARSLPRILERGSAIIGLWDYLQADSLLLKEGNTTGVPFNHIKSGEFGHIIVQAMFLHKGGEDFPRDKFSKATLDEKVTNYTATHAMRVGYITKDYLHVEHDIVLPMDEFKLEGNFEKPMPSRNFKVARRIDENYYYNFSYVSDIEFVTEFEIPAKENETKKEAAWRLHEQEERKKSYETKLKSFVENCNHVNLPKRTRVLVIDPLLELLAQADKPIDSYPFSIRFFCHLSKDVSEVKKISPGIICFSYSEEYKEELDKLMTFISTIENYSPIVMVFNTPYKSEEIQRHYSYERMITNGGPFSLEQLSSFCDVFDEKDGRAKINEGKVSYHNKEERLYLDKNNEESFLHYNFDIEVFEMSESWLLFQTETVLPLWGIFSLNEPVKMSFTVVEKLEEKEWQRSEEHHQYVGVIHSIGETDKATLRRQVNQVIYEQAEAAKKEQERVEKEAAVHRKSEEASQGESTEEKDSNKD